MRRSRIALIALFAVVITAFGALWLYTWSHVRQADTSYGPTGIFADIGGIRLHYTITGRGSPVVLLHGNPGSVRDFDRVIPQLEMDHHVLAIDRPGHGYLLAESIALHERITNAELRVLPDAGRMVLKTRPDVIGDAVRRLASRVQAPG